jgi:tetratricopeptide (TPR) repeat protein
LGSVRRNPGRSLAILLLLSLIGFGLFLAGSQFWAVYHFRAARKALDHYHPLEAGEHLQACLRIWPNDPDVLFLAARAARCAGLFDDAEEFLNRCQERRGRDDAITLERALLTAEGGDVDDVLTFCKARVEADDPDSPLILAALARGLLRDYRLLDADWAVRTWQERSPDDPMSHLLRGRVAHERYADTTAIAAYRRALEIDPELDEARDKLAAVLVETNQPREALPHLEYLCRQRPNDPALAVRLAQCRDLLGEQDEAARLLDEVLARHPDFQSALAERGKLALHAGQYAEAEGWLRRGSAAAPWDAALLEQLQLCLKQSGQTDKARALEPQLKQAKEDLEHLENLISKDIARNPLNPEPQYEAGTVLLRIGAYSEGVRRLQKAVRLNPRHVKAHEALADFYQRTGSLNQAAKHRRLAREAAAAERPKQ